MAELPASVPTTMPSLPSAPVYSLWQLMLYFLKLGSVGFGGRVAAIGAIAGAVVVLGRRSIVDTPTALLALLTLGMLWKTKKIPEPVLVLGLLLYPLIHW